jgi:TolB-like protein
MLLDVSAYELRRHGRIVRMERRPMELLILLVERQGELVTRDEIVDRLWGRDVFIDIDASVNTVIRKVRRALRDSADAPRFIQTVQGKGYRFVATVEPVGAAAVLAVLPFENLLSGADQNYVADGLTEETIAGLGRIDPDRLSVIGRTSSMTYQGTTKPIADIGRQLGADYVLEGSIRGGEGRYRVTATLIRVRDQVQVWANTYERESTNLLGLQAELGRSIAQQIHLRLSPERARAIARRQTQNPDAYDLYLRGRYHWNQLTPATVARALECYQRATELDAEYALAWAGIADAYSSRPFNSDTRPSDVYERARTAAERALSVGETVPEAHTSAAFVQFVFDWDWPAAEANCRKAVALDPSYGQGYLSSNRISGSHTSSSGRRISNLAAMHRHSTPWRRPRGCREVTPSLFRLRATPSRPWGAAAKHARSSSRWSAVHSNTTCRRTRWPWCMPG